MFSGRRFFGYRAFVRRRCWLFTALSMSVWAHHMFTTGAVADELLRADLDALIVPAGIEYFDLIGTLSAGAIRLTRADAVRARLPRCSS